MYSGLRTPGILNPAIGKLYVLQNSRRVYKHCYSDVTGEMRASPTDQCIRKNDIILILDVLALPVDLLAAEKKQVIQWVKVIHKTQFGWIVIDDIDNKILLIPVEKDCFCV